MALQREKKGRPKQGRAGALMSAHSLNQIASSAMMSTGGDQLSGATACILTSPPPLIHLSTQPMTSTRRRSRGDALGAARRRRPRGLRRRAARSRLSADLPPGLHSARHGGVSDVRDPPGDARAVDPANRIALGVRRRHLHRRRPEHDPVHRADDERQPAQQRRADRSEDAASLGRVRRAQSRHHRWSRRQRHRPRDRDPVHVRAAAASPCRRTGA